MSVQLAITVGKVLFFMSENKIKSIRKIVHETSVQSITLSISTNLIGLVAKIYRNKSRNPIYSNVAMVRQKVVKMSISHLLLCVERNKNKNNRISFIGNLKKIACSKLMKVEKSVRKKKFQLFPTFGLKWHIYRLPRISTLLRFYDVKLHLIKY